MQKFILLHGRLILASDFGAQTCQWTTPPATGSYRKCSSALWCLPEKTCCPSKNNTQIWESWYIWFGVVLIFLFLLTSLGTYFISLCKKKQQNLIRIRNFSPTSESLSGIATISGPGGIIQPDIRRFSSQANAHTSVAFAETSTEKDKVNSFADPLSPPYPPVEPVKIIKGSAPPEGFRQTDSYTEIVLPPGYIDSGNYKT